MQKELNDKIANIYQGICEIESITKFLKDSVENENNSIETVDIENTLELIICKISMTKSDVNEYIEQWV